MHSTWSAPGQEPMRQGSCDTAGGSTILHHACRVPGRWLEAVTPIERQTSGPANPSARPLGEHSL